MLRPTTYEVERAPSLERDAVKILAGRSTAADVIQVKELVAFPDTQVAHKLGVRPVEQLGLRGLVSLGRAPRVAMWIERSAVVAVLERLAATDASVFLRRCLDAVIQLVRQNDSFPNLHGHSSNQGPNPIGAFGRMSIAGRA